MGVKEQFLDMVEELSCNSDILYDLLLEYNNYVQGFYDIHDSSCCPVSVMEYYYNDFRCRY